MNGEYKGGGVCIDCKVSIYIIALLVEGGNMTRELFPEENTTFMLLQWIFLANKVCIIGLFGYCKGGTS